MLVIDFGNSRFKWALFQDDKIQSHNAFAYDVSSFVRLLELEELPLANHKIVIGCVAGDLLKKQLARYLTSRGCKNFNFLATQSNQCHVINSYAVVDNMGVDRWLALIAAFNHPARKSDEAVCVVDCGTAITVDVVASDSQHQGGLIMPGYQSVYKSLMSKTSDIQKYIGCEENATIHLLPEMSPANTLGNSTITCVDQGCAQLIKQGVTGIVSQQKKSLSGKLFCVFAGGDGEWLSQGMGEGVLYDPFLVLQGLRLAESDDC